MIIVQFYDGSFAVRRGAKNWRGKNNYEYLSNTTLKWLQWGLVDEYCKIPTYEDAQLRMMKYEQSLTPDYGVGVGPYAAVDYDR